MHLAATPADYGSDASIDRPVFVFGVPRSGTTLTLALMASHPQFAWSSQFTNRFPTRSELALVSRVLDVDVVRRYLSPEWIITPRPSEPYRLLEYVTDRAFTQPRMLTGTDVTPEVVSRYRHAVRKHLHWQGKSRYLQKHTGYPRTQYLRTIFPDAKFVHVLRDGRAVASSLLHVDFFDGTMDSWMWGEMRPEFETEYQRSGKAPIVLAAIWWKTLMDLLEPAMSELPAGQGMTVRYDRLLAAPEETMVEVADFCGVEPTRVFRQRVLGFHIDGSDDKWRRLPPDQQRLLESSLGEHLAQLGFS